VKVLPARSVVDVRRQLVSHGGGYHVIALDSTVPRRMV